jgi:outer membrane protein TolC
MNERRVNVLLAGMSMLAALISMSAQAGPLELEEAVRLALERQPQILAEQAQAHADRAAAVAERQLPDPKLMLGVKDFPVNGPAAYSFTGDDFTMVEIGVSQDFPRAEKRRLQSERRLRQAEASDAMAEQRRREVRRDVGLAWLDVFRAERSRALAGAQRSEAELFARATEVGLRTGRVAHADVLVARVAVEMLDDKAADFQQQEREARGMLSRWVGEAAQEALPDALPQWPPPPDLPELLRHVETHPHIEALAKQEAVAHTEIALAEQAYRPDWSLDAYYANRPDFADFVGLRVTVDLPFFTAHRQDRSLEESRALLDQVSAEREDARRLQASEARTARATWEAVSARLARFDATILPQARGASEAAQAAYGAGQGTLASVLQARQAVLAVELQRLDLATEAARAQLRMRYLIE